MLRLKDIRKNYKVADTEVEALKGINLSFRKSEFVSILGPSGCGKTTTLNIIGGLDKYTSGDLFIAGKSTKNFNDHDWDVYRNHRIGFIFQSYNLIPHQTILGNVELALTISGMPKKERVEKAKKALDRVGLKGQYNKKPNQLSGGQCQRVAIARALVNEPEILLADEPTGALDTVTSVQIMDLIKEISKEKLVIMVTHNPELAEKYSTRIVRLLDGEVLEDSNPFKEEEEIKETENIEIINREVKIKEKAKMSLWTAFMLSSKNLYSKFKRTLMVALAGCIGIVGVSTVLSVSSGVQNYIHNMENDMLSGNPVYITTSSLDYSSILGGGLMAGNNNQVNIDNDITKIFINSLVKTLYNMNGVTSTNKIGKEYMDFLAEMPDENCALIQYDYGYSIAPNLFTDFKAGDGKTHKMSISAIQANYASVLKNVEDLKDYASMINSVSVMTEIPSNSSYLANQYDVIYIEEGYSLEDVINDKEALIAVASKNNNTLNDLELAEYGYFTQEQFLNYCYKIGNSNLYNPNSLLELPESISYETLAKKKFTWYPNDVVYTKGESDNEDLGDKYYASAYADGSLANETDEKYSKYKRDAFGSVDGMVDLNVKCVLKLKENLSYGCLSSGGLYYTNELSKHIRNYTFGNEKQGIAQSEIVESAIKQNGLYNVEMGYMFKFDGNSKVTCETYNLSTSSAIMDYISQFMGSSENSAKKITSYSTAAVGGEEYPTTVYFYCNDFKQKDLLIEYLNIWNDNKATNLYKVDTNGFYVGKKQNEDGKEETVYFYKDDLSGKFFQVNINSDGFATDYKGNQYKLEEDEYGNMGFYIKLSDSIGDKFAIEGTIKVNDTVSINAYSLLSYVIFGDEFQKSNMNYSHLEEVADKGGVLYRYTNADNEYEYVMKVKNQSFYKMNLDKEGNVLASQNGYDKYRYNEEENKFYKDEYVKGLDDKYTLVSTEVAEEDVKKLYASNDLYAYANVVKNPTYKVAGNEYTIDTKGLYLDASSLTDIMDNIIVDNVNKIITLEDYSKASFYYKDLSDTDDTYYCVEIDEDGYLIATDAADYIESSSLNDVDLSNYVAKRYLINSDGTLQAVNPAYSTTAVTTQELINNKIIGDELTDLSVLEIDESLKINHTDMIGLIVDMVNTLIQVITYALIAFTALSLVVSTVMIGIITYVSVVERIKEIGVIRSLGGRKKDVSHLFNAETLIIGTAAGLLGIGITYLLSLIINLIVGHFSGIYTIASLPWYEAVIMVVLSIVLTLISGLIPARSAARKDPVVALRTE